MIPKVSAPPPRSRVVLILRMLIDDDFGRIVTQTLIPVIRSLQHDQLLNAFLNQQLVHHPEHDVQPHYLCCSDLCQSDRIFEGVEKLYVGACSRLVCLLIEFCLFSTFRLDKRSKLWDLLKDNLPVPRVASPLPYVLPVVEVVSPIKLDTGACPVNEGNREAFTAQEREKAERRIEARDLAHLKELV